MRPKHTLADLRTCPEEVFEFIGEHGLYTYKRDKTARDAFNKLMGTKVCKYLFREVNAMASGRREEPCMEFDTGHTYLVMANGKVLHLSNSEWASLAPV